MTRTSAPPSGVVARPTDAAADVLVPRRDQLLVARQVDPQLDAVEQATLGDQPLRRRLDVQQARPGGHPLRVAVGDRPAAALAVLVVEDAVHDVGDRLEAPVRVPRRALGLARRILHLTHLVHVDERVQPPEVHAGERPADREALALEPARGVGPLDHRARHGRECGSRDARQDAGVGHGDGGHEDHSFSRQLILQRV